jgi:hypothetical protein
MPTSPENLAMFESDWPGTGWNRGKSSGLPGPRRDGDLDTLAPGRLAKFHAPEIVFGPGALAELGHCTARTALKDACLATNPRAAGAGDIAALFRAALCRGRHRPDRGTMIARTAIWTS